MGFRSHFYFLAVLKEKLVRTCVCCIWFWDEGKDRRYEASGAVDGHKVIIQF